MPISIKAQIAQLVSDFKAKAADGLSWTEIFAFVRQLVAALMAIVAVLDVPGPEKRQMVLQAVSEVLDYVFAAGLAFPGLPWLLRILLSYAGPALKTILLDAADQWLETTYLREFKLAA